LTGKDEISVNEISSIKIIFNKPVEIAMDGNTQDTSPAVSWMGN
jgi:hypothetical protein